MEKWGAWMPWFCILAGIAVMAYWIGKAYACRMRLLEMQLQHEERMRKEEWERKLECDKLYKDQLLKEKEEKIESLQKTVNEQNLNKKSRIDVELMILYFYNLSDKKQPLTLEELKERADAFRHICKAIQDKL